MTPREALELHLKKAACGIYHPEKISVVSWFLPAMKAVRLSLRKENEICSLRWNYARHIGQDCNFRLSRYLVVQLESLGHHAIAPELESWWSTKREGDAPVSSAWSQRHIAYAAGLGTFSLSDGFITAKGMAGRFGSIVCDLYIPPTPRTCENRFANCLYYRDKSCTRCIERCPVGAITEQGHDKIKCHDYLFNGMPKMIAEQGNREPFVGAYVGCGFCQTRVPCEDRIPSTIVNNCQNRVSTF